MDDLLCDNGGNERVSSISTRDDGERVVISSIGNGLFCFIQAGVGEVPQLMELVSFELVNGNKGGQNERQRGNSLVGNGGEF